MASYSMIVCKLKQREPQWIKSSSRFAIDGRAGVRQTRCIPPYTNTPYAANQYIDMFIYFFSFLRFFFGIIRCGEYFGGGGGRIPNFPNNHATRSDGCAPTEIQYLSRSVFSRISLIPCRLAMGLYVPT